jgi:hypothetical protein
VLVELPVKADSAAKLDLVPMPESVLSTPMAVMVVLVEGVGMAAMVEPVATVEVVGPADRAD